MTWVMLFLIGLCAGILGSVVGLGGGIILVPAMLFFGTYTSILTEISPQMAVGTSLLVIIFTGLASTLSYMKQGTVDYKSAFLFFAGSGPGGIVGAYINRYLNVDQFQLYFGLLMIFLAIVLMFRDKMKQVEEKEIKGFVRRFRDPQGKEYVYGFSPITGLGVSFIVGLLSGLFGIGGGSLMVPIMMMLFQFPPHVAVATSMMMIFLSSIVSSTAHIALGHIEWLYAISLIPGAWIGGRLGAAINKKMQGNSVVILLRVVLVVIGVRLIYQSF
ncbi:sulfite exporter TauE/SafE family protein [Bacillus tianshenii]|nr:sulfite exporter TauE/SafE family protein [Bacillus tianshenii]